MQAANRSQGRLTTPGSEEGQKTVLQDPTTPRFTLEGGTLKITGDLHIAVESNFRAETDKLLGLAVKPLVLDITDVQYRGSSYVRLIAMAMIRANELSVDLTIRATARTVRILEMGGLEKLGHIETVPDA